MAEKPPSSPEAARRAALDLLGRRTHFESELVRKLATRGFAAEHVAEALERLRRAGLVDDRRSAVEFVDSRLRRGPRGGRRLRAELEQRGVPAEAIDAALGEALPGDETELARAAARKFARRRRGADARALARHLAGLGFSTRVILTLVEESQDLQPSDDGC